MQSFKSQKSQPATSTKLVVSQSQFIPHREPTNNFFFPSTHNNQARSNSLSQFTYSTYPTPDEIFVTPYDSPETSLAIATSDAHPNYLNTSAVPMILSPMTHFSDTTKQESCPSDDKWTPYTTYSYMPPIDFNTSSPYDQSDPHVSYVMLCYVYFSSGGREARKVPYWGTGRAELESLVLKST
jgi:hypothetical protein